MKLLFHCEVFTRSSTVFRQQIITFMLTYLIYQYIATVVSSNIEDKWAVKHAVKGLYCVHTELKF